MINHIEKIFDFFYIIYHAYKLNLRKLESHDVYSNIILLKYERIYYKPIIKDIINRFIQLKALSNLFLYFI